MTSGDWSAFRDGVRELAAAYGRRIPEEQVERWHDAVRELRQPVVLEALDRLAETSANFPTLAKLLEVYRSLAGGGDRRCAACGGTGVVFSREARPDEEVVGVEEWHGKRAVRCRCRLAGGKPLATDPSLPGNPACVCGGRGWMPYPSRDQIPEGRRYLGEMLSGRVMGSCPCRRVERVEDVRREAIAVEAEPAPAAQSDLLAGEWDPISAHWTAHYD